MKKISVLIVALFIGMSSFAQMTKADVFGRKEVTWLGLDFSQVNFIGDAAQWKDAGNVTSDQLRDNYFVSWNELFEKEQSKYDVGKAISRTGVDYALDVTEKVNNRLNRDFFSDNGNDYKHLDEQKIKKLVSKYNFQGNKGLGLMFFVEGMSKGKTSASMWVTFVDMNTKKVLFTKRVEGKASGFGFRNYWAKSFYNVLKTMWTGSFKQWKKG